MGLAFITSLLCLILDEGCWHTMLCSDGNLKLVLRTSVFPISTPPFSPGPHTCLTDRVVWLVVNR